MATEKFCLKWNDFESNISVAFRDIRDEKDFFDVTLACDDDQIQAHKVILSACSPFFRNVLKRNPHQHPLLYLKGVKYTDLQSVLNFMYHGEVNVAQDELNSFLAVAEELRVKGLTQNSQGGPGKTTSAPKSPPPPPKSRASDSAAPPPKRSRPNPPPPVPSQPSYTQQDDDDIQEVVPVKSEPRDTPAAPLVDSYSNTALAPSNQHQLQTEEEANYEESYDDYGQYDQNYDNTMMDPNMSGDGNKGVGRPTAGLDELAEIHLTKDIHRGGYICNLCGKSVRDKYAGKNHLEGKHFPTDGGYACTRCNKKMNTRKALSAHTDHCNLVRQGCYTGHPVQNYI